MNPSHTMTASTGVSRAARDGEGAGSSSASRFCRAARATAARATATAPPGSSSASSVWTFAFAPFAAAFFAGFFLERGMGRAASLG